MYIKYVPKMPLTMLFFGYKFLILGCFLYYSSCERLKEKKWDYFYGLLNVQIKACGEEGSSVANMQTGVGNS